MKIEFRFEGDLEKFIEKIWRKWFPKKFVDDINPKPLHAETTCDKSVKQIVTDKEKELLMDFKNGWKNPEFLKEVESKWNSGEHIKRVEHLKGHTIQWIPGQKDSEKKIDW